MIVIARESVERQTTEAIFFYGKTRLFRLLNPALSGIKKAGLR
jgi:hypothetical protein